MKTLFLPVALILALITLTVALPSLQSRWRSPPAPLATQLAEPAWTVPDDAELEVGPADDTGGPGPGMTSEQSLATAEGLTVEVKLAQPVALLSTDDLYAQVELRAEGAGKRTPAALVLVLDRSGSMAGQKLEDARAAARALIERLSEKDRLGLVHYGSDAVAIPLRRCSPDHRRTLLAAVDALQESGGTNIGAALDSAARLLKETSSGRVVLVSDGNPTEGDIRPDELLARARQLRSVGHALTSIGVGTDFNERLMQNLSEEGGGLYGFLEGSAALAGILERELHQATHPVAQGVELRLDPTLLSRIEVIGRPSESWGRGVKVRLPDLGAGQSERVMVRVRPLGAILGRRMPLLTAHVTFDAPARPHAGVGSVSGWVRFTDDPAEAQRHRDEPVFANALRALGGVKLERAQEELRAGRVEEARSLLDDVRGIYSASADLLSGDLFRLGTSAQALAGSPSSQTIAVEQKKAHQRALENFGATTY